MRTTRFKKAVPLTTERIKFTTAETNPADLIPGESFPWRRVLPQLHRVAQTFGYQRVETSPIESLDVFAGHKDLLGDYQASELVHLEADQARRFALRPHNFLSVLRAYITNQVFEREKITKWYYILPNFSFQKNCFAQEYEFGMVSFGEPASICDAQMIAMLKMLLEQLGIKNFVFEINSKGCEDCRPYYQELLTDYLHQNKYELCGNCQQLFGKEASYKGDRRTGENLLSLFACANGGCQNLLASAPQIIDYLDPACNHQLTSLLESLDELEISYQLNPMLFGHNKFSHLVFRVRLDQSVSEPGSVPQFLGLGGRHSTFVSKVIGQDIPTLVFSVPLAALHQLAAGQDTVLKDEHTAQVFLINLGELAAKKSLRLFLDLLKNNITVAEHFGENGIKNQFKLAEKNGCFIALVVGQKEALDDTIILRDIRSGIQEVFSRERIIDEVKRRLQE